jgi:2-succinyl-5-enolpyruvyl-6-hydroxy-3-cyclohexene-1-carboxylate synthase
LQIQNKHHWHIDSLRAYDTFNALTKHFEVEPNVFDAFLPLTKSIESDYFKKLDLMIIARAEKAKSIWIKFHSQILNFSKK